MVESTPNELVFDAEQLSRRESSEIQKALLGLHPLLLDEIQFWYDGLRVVDEEDLDYEDGYENLPPPPKLNGPWKRIVQIASENFTCKLVNEGLSKALKLQLLFNGPPDSNMAEKGLLGGYGYVTAVKLTSPIELTVEVVEESSTVSKVVWRVSKVAVKLNGQYYPSKEYAFCTRVVREARIWSRMRHRNIVPLLGLWSNFKEDSIFHGLVSPWFEEGSLSNAYRNNTLSVKKKLSYLRDIVSALAYMHNHEFQAVHGDLRADNVLVKDGHAYLMDFGLSRLQDDVKGFSSSKEIGNVQWLAPERCYYATEKATKMSDIYEFASVFYEVWTEDSPWLRVPSQFVIKEISENRRPHRPDDMPDEYWQFISWCWNSDFMARPSALEAVSTFDRFLDNIALNSSN